VRAASWTRVVRVIRTIRPDLADVVITTATHLVDDLGFDWDMYNNLAAEFQREFGRRLTLAGLESIARVRDLIRLAEGAH